ncbi:MAG: sodium:calcium antiporter [Candidatus Woesearchaeota archaeon]
MVLAHIFWFLLACLGLILSSIGLLRSIEKISFFLKIKLFIISFFILGIGTSLPELFVGINSALLNKSSISFGNIVGANIIDITLIVGIPILILRSIRIESKSERKDILYMFILVLLPIAMLFFDNKISRIEGCILIATFLLYNYNLLREEKEFEKKAKEGIKRTSIFLYFITAFLCIISLYYSAKYAIDYAVFIAQDLNLSHIFIGLFILSVGTTLPEMVVSIQSLMQGKRDLMVGNVVGSLVTNSTLIIGVVAVINPIYVSFYFMTIPFIFLIFSVLLFIAFAEHGRTIGVSQGTVMVFLYILFLIVELTLKSAKIA